MHNWPSCMPITLSKDLSGSKFSGSLQFQDIILGTHIPQLRILVDVDTRRLPNKWPYGWLLPFGPNQLTSTKWPCKISSFFFLLLNFNSHIIHPFSTFSLIFNFFFNFFLISQLIVTLSLTFCLPFIFSSKILLSTLISLFLYPFIFLYFFFFSYSPPLLLFSFPFYSSLFHTQ